jgi:hypothetical protein
MTTGIALKVMPICATSTEPRSSWHSSGLCSSAPDEGSFTRRKAVQWRVAPLVEIAGGGADWLPGGRRCSGDAEKRRLAPSFRTPTCCQRC